MTENQPTSTQFNSIAGTVTGLVKGSVSVSEHGLQVTREGEIRALDGENAVELVNRSISGSIVNAGTITSQGGGGIVIKGATLVGDIVNLGNIGASQKSQGE
ncbi:hypothetical protein [Polynucleobacter sphagniphilus]|jgi:hypothetical protein|uniref:Uncharacterized protein n=1 Tax=Polynucleobacter sphagniphilus TaxID=1743169 RepID=A0AA43MBL0_9BURK|nr:hypothetical protein [Polynucleobacter sphagniphilus]MDH6504767.1 hypothetical protein [Polynucleobacter sphagniphilus]MDH6513488.1 hypothetical protein [Polynucleobacter sphagniphilus]